MDIVGTTAASLQFATTVYQALQTISAVTRSDHNEPIVALRRVVPVLQGECTTFLREHANASSPTLRDASAIAEQAYRLALSLEHKLDRLNPKKKNPATLAVALFHLLWSKEELAELQRGLDTCLQALDRFQTQHGINTLISINAAKEARDSSQWNQLFRQDAEKRAKLADQKKTDLLLQALAFPGMGDRYGYVHEAAKNTFGWILEHSKNRRHRLTADFVAWLTHGDGIFQIAGKPGSGKSTLMKYLFEHEQTKSLLEEWAVRSSGSDGRATLVLASCFFWKPGSPLQRNILGLKRTLLHGILTACHGTGAVLFPDIWKAHDTATRVQIMLSDRDIRLAFDRLTDGAVHGASSSRSSSDIYRYRFCFFIDGLDEFGEAGDTIVGLVRQLKKLATGAAGRIKLCVSSREYPEITKSLALDDAHRLTLHDLTCRDIASLVDRRLRDIFPVYASDAMKNDDAADSDASDSDAADSDDLYFDVSDRNPAKGEVMDIDFAIACDIRDKILKRAQGVFLWVVLVLGLIEAEVELDTTPASALPALVEAQHDDLTEFLHGVVARIPERDRRAVALVLLYAKGLSTPRELLYYAFLLNGYTTDDEFERHCACVREQLLTASPELARKTKAWIKRRCEGLLEISNKNVPPALQGIWGWDVQATHRSLHEFFTSLLATTWSMYTVSAADYSSIAVRIIHATRGVAEPMPTIRWYFSCQEKSLVDTGLDARVHRNFLLVDEFDDHERHSKAHDTVAVIAVYNQFYHYLQWLQRHRTQKIMGRTDEMFSIVRQSLQFRGFLPTLEVLFMAGGHWDGSGPGSVPLPHIAWSAALYPAGYIFLKKTICLVLSLFARSKGVLPMLVRVPSGDMFSYSEADGNFILNEYKIEPRHGWPGWLGDQLKIAILSLAFFVEFHLGPDKVTSQILEREPFSAQETRAQRLLQSDDFRLGWGKIEKHNGWTPKQWEIFLCDEKYDPATGVKHPVVRQVDVLGGEGVGS